MRPSELTEAQEMSREGSKVDQQSRNQEQAAQPVTQKHFARGERIDLKEF